MRRQKKKQEGAAKLWNQVARMCMPWMVVCILAFGASMVYAKYIQTSQYNDAVTAREFYFSSDVLDGGVHEIPALDVDENGMTTATLTFHLMNHEDQLRYSDVAIAYEVAWEEGQKNTAETDHVGPVDGNDSETSVNDKKKIGTIAAGEGHNGQTNDQTVTISGLEQGKTYTVTAAATAPYTKTLSATIKVQEQDLALHATLADYGSYMEITVWTVDYNGLVTLNCADTLIPDNTDSMLENAVTGTPIRNISMSENTSHVFRFFKSDSSKGYHCQVSKNEVSENEVSVEVSEVSVQ